jgi:2-polyprenyl-3-methyl-5-hydroxy-6-metoxy-1,4-benzoquinol methylase
MELVTLQDIGKLEFISQIQEFHKFNDANSNWFDKDQSHSIINTIDEYSYWTIMVNSANKIMAFAAVNETQFEKYNCIRLMSRTFYHPDIRRKNIRYEYNNATAPVMIMLQQQMEFVKDRSQALIITMEKLTHRGNLDHFFKKCNRLLGHEWQLLPGMYQTTPKSWQNLGVYGNKEITIPNMDIEEWRMKNGC